MRCINPLCGFENPEGNKFCLECGTPMPQKLVCRHCKGDLPPNVKFCPECGTPAEATGTRVAPAAEPQAGGIGIGERNVIAGDIIGKKEEYHVGGDATFVTIDDDSKKIAGCKICGKNVPLGDGYVCPTCGRFVCADHYFAARHACMICAQSSLSAKELELDSLIQYAYADGILDAEDRREIDEAARRLGIASDVAEEIEKRIAMKLRAPRRDLSQAKKHAFTTASRCLYEEYDLLRASEALSSVTFTETDDSSLLGIYLDVMKDANPDLALEVIGTINFDSKEAHLARADISLARKKPLAAMDSLEEALSLWPDDEMLLVKKAEVACCQYIRSRDVSNLAEAEAILAALASRPLDGEASGYRTYVAAFARKLRGDRLAMQHGRERSSVGDRSAYRFLRYLRRPPVLGGGQADYADLRDALADADENGQILVKGHVECQGGEIPQSVRLTGFSDADEGAGAPSLVIAGTSPLCVSGEVEIMGISLRGGCAGEVRRERSGDPCEGASPLVEVSGKLHLSDCRIGPLAGRVFAVARGNGSLRLSDCAIETGAFAENEAALIGRENASMELAGSTIKDCRPIGILMAGASSLSVSDCVFSGNGSAIKTDGEAVCTVDGSRFEANKDGINVASQAKTKMRRCAFRGNDTGISCERGEASLIEDSTFDGDNNAVNVDGRDVHFMAADCEISNAKKPGLVAKKGAVLHATGCRIGNGAQNCIVSMDGGKVYLERCRLDSSQGDFSLFGIMAAFASALECEFSTRDVSVAVAYSDSCMEIRGCNFDHCLGNIAFYPDGNSKIVLYDSTVKGYSRIRDVSLGGHVLLEGGSAFLPR